jgi:hypothetical protein
MPTAVGFPQEEVFEHELRFAGGKLSHAGWAIYSKIEAVGQCLGSDHFIKRTAVRTDKIDFGSLDQQSIAYWTVTVTLT